MYRILKPNGYLFIDAMNVWHMGEGLEFKRSRSLAVYEYLRSIINPNIEVGDKLFQTEKDGKPIKGFFHGFTDREMRNLLENSGFDIEKRYIIGYNSGEIKNKKTEGQFFYICRKINEVN